MMKNKDISDFLKKIIDSDNDSFEQWFDKFLKSFDENIVEYADFKYEEEIISAYYSHKFYFKYENCL
jgi:hypothetical protein